MKDVAGHANLSPERWHSMSLVEQMGNIGTEVARALRARESGDAERMTLALERALTLFDLTSSDPGLRSRQKEIRRAREVVLDYLVGDNDWGSSASDLDGYFLPYAVAARAGR